MEIRRVFDGRGQNKKKADAGDHGQDQSGAEDEDEYVAVVVEVNEVIVLWGRGG